MANDEHVKLLKLGSKQWNYWREENPQLRPDLFQAILPNRIDLREVNLSEVNLNEFYVREANLKGANFKGAKLRSTYLINANLAGANLIHVDLTTANLCNADLTKADLNGANLRKANLTNANLLGANLIRANLSEATLDHVNLNKAILGGTVIGNTDLSLVRGLENIRHRGPSTIGVDALYKSAGKISKTFLEGCGIPDELITYIPSLIGTAQAIQFHSCFISYSHKDEGFVEQLYSRLREAHIRVWFAPEDIRGGEKIYDQIDYAIQIHDRLLIVLSENSLQSEWVKTEIRKARKAEISEKRRKLFPIRLVDMDVIRAWECFDADSGKDLAVELREYFISDFRGWKNHSAFETAFEKLIRDLKAEESRRGNV